MNIPTKKVMGIIILMLSPFLVYGQILDPVSYSVTNAPKQVKAGEPFSITIKATIDGDWHLYAVHNDPDAGPFPTEFSSDNSKLSISGDISESKPFVEVDPNFNAKLGYHKGSATFQIPLTFNRSVTGSSMIALKVHYQVCNDKTCLPPKSKTITQAISVSGGSGDTTQAIQSSKKSEPPASVTGNNSDTSNGTIAAGGYESKGFFSFLWIALTAGFAALLTPCVFPMIPLTVSFFAKQNEREKKKGIGQALFFGIAIVLTFTVIGALLALLIGASGANKFASNPWVNLFIAIILILFSISLLGAFELRLPYQLTNWLNRKSNERSGVVGILFMAMTISAVSFSCTAPFVGGVLAATTGGQWFYPIIGMAAFATAFASPFVLFALFPGWLESLPKSGSWMNVVKVLLGFIELAAAIKFLSNVDLVWQWGLISRPFAIAAWIAIFLLAGLYVLGVYTLTHDTKPKQIGTGRLLLALPFILFSFYLIPGLMGASLGIWDSWLPPKQATDVSVVSTLAQQQVSGTNFNEQENWSHDYQQSLKTAREQNKPIFIDFTGYTCTNCRAMEANVFPLKSVQKRFAKMQQVRLYTDDGSKGPQNQKFQFKLTGTVALPTYVVVDPEDEMVLEQLVGYAGKEKFEQFLDTGMQRFAKRNKEFQIGLN
ncbi:MAG TPA: cytochrome c biogenesis protein CcdA [Balneolaceae bacterium]|nr:cytochrome c biogenesis protein CcdA [Balneolaceae bacterium]